MTTETFELLSWDSAFFGFAVARICRPTMDDGVLGQTLAALRHREVRLAYWPIPSDETKVQDTAQRAGGFLADRKVTYIAPLPLPESTRRPRSCVVAPYESVDMCPALDTLAITSGEFSRFRVDPNFPRALFEALYREWMARSVDGSFARQVLVARDHATEIVGVVTLGEKNGRGDIGLVAVDRGYHGRGIGQALVASAGTWFASNGFTMSQVVTQGANIPACRLYERAGYTSEKVECLYHFWL